MSVHSLLLAQLMNFTSDNVSTNDKTMRELAKLLDKDDIELDASDQQSQYISLLVLASVLLNLSVSCFTHAVSLAVKAFLSALSPRALTKTQPPTTAGGDAASSTTNRNEDTEETLYSQLLDDLEATDFVAGCDHEVKLLAALLPKIQAFIAKV